VNIASRLMGLLGLGVVVLLALTLLRLDAVHAGGSGVRLGGARHVGQDIAFRVTDQRSAPTQAVVFPSRPVAFSLTHRVWARAPGAAGAGGTTGARVAAPQSAVRPVWTAAARVPPTDPVATVGRPAPGGTGGPVSGVHLSTGAADDPVEAHVAWTTAGLWLQLLRVWTLSLSPEVSGTSPLERVTGGMPVTLSAAWSVSDAIGAQTLDLPAASHTVTTQSRSPYGHMRLQLAHSPEEMTVGVLIDVVTFLRRTLGV
jgi:hypothetical protein